MRIRTLCLFVALGMLAAALPSSSGADSDKVDIPFGYLVRDSSCPGASYALLSPCPPHPVGMYLALPPGNNVDRLLGMNVAVRGTIDAESECAYPLVRASKIIASDVNPPCPPPQQP